MVRPIQVSNPKLTMEINGGLNGWTESHFYTSQVPLSDAGLITAAKALCRARCKALDGVNSKMFAARVSLDDVNRDAAPVDIDNLTPDPVTGYFSIGGPNPSDHTTWAYQTVQVSWHIYLQTVNSTTNPQEYLAGMPARTGQFGSGPYDSLPPQPATYLIAYLNTLINGSWGALGRDWTSSLYDIASIIFVDVAGPIPAHFQITFKTPFPSANIFPAGAYCRLQNAVYTSPQKRIRLNGTYTVSSYDATAGLLRVDVPRVLVAPNFTAYGNMQSADGNVFTYTNYVFRPITHRKRGRPFGGGRGRR